MDQKDWNRLAKMCASDAHEHHFPSRRGIWHVEDLDVLVIYNNNPYSEGPHLRDEEVAKIRLWLQAAGIEELAYATYPEDGYTFAMVIRAGEDQLGRVADAVTEITLKTLRSC
jgi:hypothetical protein